MSFACGPFSLDAVFVFTVHPEYPLENFARGEIGVVQPSYARSYLYVAYRYLKGERFDETGQKALLDLWHERLDLRWESGEEQAVKSWLSARQKVPGLAGPDPKIEVYRSREKPNDYETYLNCQNDAFEVAATTLEARLKRMGSDSVGLKSWVEAQDQVFANCSEGQHIPAALPADADALLRADRQYQIAAANFYSSNFAGARTLFESIAADDKSPWRLSAPYLIARTLLRQASLGPEDGKKKSLAEAEEQLNQILVRKELKDSHPAARRLLSLVRLRLHPEEVLHELAVSLSGKGDSSNLKQTLWDYTILLDQFVGDNEAHHQKTETPPAVLAADDLTDWIVTFQSDKPDALEHSLARWQATNSIPWLVASIAKIDAKNPRAAALQQAAARIPSASPAFPSASFHAIRLDIAAGRTSEARTKLDDILRRHRSQLAVSAVNLFQQQRMLVTSSLDDFITYAQRLPAGFTWNADGREIPADASEITEDTKALTGKPLFDSDAADILNRRLPLGLLREAADNNRLPTHLRLDVLQAAWLRAVLLGDNSTALALSPNLKAMVPEMTQLLNDFGAAPDDAGKKFSALFAWLKFPAMEPVVKAGAGRRTKLDEQDSYRDNWWCSAAITAPETDGEKAPPPPAERIGPSFLTAAQRTAAERESATLKSFGAAPNYLSREVIAWATNHPTDRRVPEALHLAVKTTRYGCTDKQTGRWSKAAYDFLHKRYPGNEWTKRTPYWFKD
jgi:hypothetical protein